AARLVLSYTLGKPAEATDPDALDVQEWQHFHDQAVEYADLTRLFQTVPAPLANRFAGATLPGLESDLKRMLREGLAERVQRDAEAASSAEAPAPPGPRRSRRRAAR